MLLAISIFVLAWVLLGWFFSTVLGGTTGGTRGSVLMDLYDIDGEKGTQDDTK